MEINQSEIISSSRPMSVKKSHGIYCVEVQLLWIAMFLCSAFLHAAEPDILTKDNDLERGKRYVILFSVNQFDCTDLSPLSSCYNDMIYAHKYWLTPNREFQPENIYFLHDVNQKQPDLLPTRENFLRVFHEIAGKMTADDSIYILISSHGIANNGRSFICPKDTKGITFPVPTETITVSSEGNTIIETGQNQSVVEYGTTVNNLISVTELLQELQEVSADRRFLVFDTCRDNPEEKEDFRVENDFLQEFQNTLRTQQKSGLAVMTSCSLKQQAQQLYRGEQTYGVFMYFFIEGLMGNADLTGAYDGQISLIEAYNYANIHTRRYTRNHYGREQSPELYEASKINQDISIEGESNQIISKDINQTILSRYDILQKSDQENDIQYAIRTGNILTRKPNPDYRFVTRIFDYVIDNQPNNVLARAIHGYACRATGDYQRALDDQTRLGGELRLFVRGGTDNPSGAYVFQSSDDLSPIILDGKKQGFRVGDQITIDQIEGNRLHVASWNNRPTAYSCWIKRDDVHWDREVARTSIIGTPTTPGRNYSVAPPAPAPAFTPTPIYSPQGGSSGGSGGGGGPSINI